jgi:hypothetical protein
MKELTFCVIDAEKINRKYCGKHIVIVDDKVVASESDPKDVWRKPKRKQPVLTFVPKEDTIVLLRKP